MTKNIIILAVAVAAITSVLLLADVSGASNLTQDPPKTVDYVDIAKYLGGWYEISAIPFYFERNCERTKATYSLNADQTIRVDNLCYRNGKKVESIGKAFPDPNDATKSNAKLKVEFSSTLDIQANYWIVRLDKDYTRVVISSPNYAYLWILSREPVMDPKLYDSIVADLKNDNFPVEKLKKTVQV
jgi:apolipoprotein D and lipocalin family protein